MLNYMQILSQTKSRPNRTALCISFTGLVTFPGKRAGTSPTVPGIETPTHDRQGAK